MADIKQAYAASSDLTVTNLHSLASSTTYVAGWESGLIDNTTNKYLDYRVTAKIITGVTVTAAEIRLYLVAMLDDSTWPDVFDGTEGAETITLSQIRDAICVLGAVTANTATNSITYYLDCPSVASAFGGNMPAKFVIFITHASVATLAAASNQVTIKGSYQTVV